MEGFRRLRVAIGITLTVTAVLFITLTVAGLMMTAPAPRAGITIETGAQWACVLLGVGVVGTAIYSDRLGALTKGLGCWLAAGFINLIARPDPSFIQLGLLLAVVAALYGAYLLIMWIADGFLHPKT